ncbi:thioesterase family protein [uncultured Paraglaciecola sp.]|uniref:acyl-CoA thioesterase n=1 Tax=uncultured Paraglaciecola sp. TaxID=1765024 RepID=UPI0026099B74|nr:thioesterase family protein [uncultured Paraglaciecola sp.]
MLSEKFNVRFYETDALAHVSNTVIAGWFESGREPIFRIFTPELDLKNWPLILASYKIDFLEQLFLGKPVEIRTYVARLGGSSFDTYQEVWQDGKKCASGTSTMVKFDYKTSKAVKLSDSERKLLNEHWIDTTN